VFRLFAVVVALDLLVSKQFMGLWFHGFMVSWFPIILTQLFYQYNIIIEVVWNNFIKNLI